MFYDLLHFLKFWTDSWNWNISGYNCTKVIGISGSLIWSKTLMELIFNPCGDFRWSPEGPVSQIHSLHLHVGAPGTFSDLLRSVQMLKREWGEESNGKLMHLFIPSKTATLVPEFVAEDLPLAELQPWFLRLQWRTCPWAEYSDDDNDTYKRNTMYYSLQFSDRNYFYLGQPV